MRVPYPDGVTRQDVLDAIHAFDSGTPHEFADSTDFDLLLPDGRRYPPKAISGLAAKRVAGRILKPEDFSSGEGSRCFRMLRENGFEIAPKENGAKPETEGDWNDSELRAAASAYLEMLDKERQGVSYSKASYNTALRNGALQKRSKGSVEFRMQNISATLQTIGLPWIAGYKPRKNIGSNVTRRILSILASVAPEQFSEFLPSTDEKENRAKSRAILKRKEFKKPEGTEKPIGVPRTVISYERSPAVRAFVLKEAAGVCELCLAPAPFVDEFGEPFLEVHHVQPLGEKGADTVENAVALCPNCHRRLHHSANRIQALATLYRQVSRLCPVQTDS